MKKGYLIARGRTAEVFQCGNNRILKLFLDRNRAIDAEREAQNTRLVYDAGLPVPSVGSIVEVDGRSGIVFEHIEGPSMMAILSSKPWKVIAFARWLAELQIQMHSCKVPERPSQRKRLEKHIRGAAPLRGDMKDVVIGTKRPIANSLRFSFLARKSGARAPAPRRRIQATTAACATNPDTAAARNRI